MFDTSDEPSLGRVFGSLLAELLPAVVLVLSIFLDELDIGWFGGLARSIVG